MIRHLKTHLITVASFLFLLFSSQYSFSQTDNPDLNQLLSDLQGTPEGSLSETIIKEQIIEFVLALDYPPEAPMDYRRYVVRGEMATEMAKDPAGFEAAVKEYREAARMAPWMAEAHYNLAKAEEKASNPRGAIAAYKMYLKAAPEAFDRSTVEDRIFRMEYQLEVGATQPQTKTTQTVQQTQTAQAAPQPTEEVETIDMSRNELLFYQNADDLPVATNLKSLSADFERLSKFPTTGKVLVSYDIGADGKTLNYKFHDATKSDVYDAEAEWVVGKLKFAKGNPRQGVVQAFTFCRRSDRVYIDFCDITFEKSNDAAKNAPRLVSFLMPDYNSNASRRKYCGNVTIRFDILDNGSTANQEIVGTSEHSGQFGINTIESVSTFHYKEGNPTEGVEYLVTYGLPGKC